MPNLANSNLRREFTARNLRSDPPHRRAHHGLVKLPLPTRSSPRKKWTKSFSSAAPPLRSSQTAGDYFERPPHCELNPDEVVAPARRFKPTSSKAASKPCCFDVTPLFSESKQWVA
jgi:hypothetical protein